MNVGDEVLIIGWGEEEYDPNGVGIADDMREYVGQTGEITQVYDEYRVKITTDNGYFYWDKCWLEKINSSPDEKVAGMLYSILEDLQG